MSIARPISLLLVVLLAAVIQLPYPAPASTSPPISVVLDSASGLNSVGLPGGEKLIQDSFNRTILVYVDSNSPARLGISFANSNPTVASSWSMPTKSVAPSSSYARPAAVLVNATRLRIIVEGGSASGRISDISVTIQRDAQNNIQSLVFGSTIILDTSGNAHYPTATLAQNGDILAAWNFHDATSSRVKAFSWRPGGIGWRGFGGSSLVPDDAVVDTSNLKDIFPSIIERQDNRNVYVMGNEGSLLPPSTGATNLVYNKATFDGTNWSWGPANLAYESTAARGSEDAPSLAWDPVHSLVVVAYDVSNTNHYGVFTLSSSDQKTHRDTPDLILSDNDWGNIVTDQTTGDYYLILVDASSDGGTGRVAYTKSASGTGPWNTTLTNIDSSTTNRGLIVRRTGSGSTIDLVYANEATTPAGIRFVRMTNTPSSLTADFTFTPSSPAPGQSVTFTGTASGGTPPYTYSWNFGDSGVGSGVTVSHTYSQGGGYTVTLTVTDNSARTATAQHVVAVGTFTFAAAGDWGYNSRTTANWASLSTSGASFVIPLGDLLYNFVLSGPSTEQDWCANFKANIANVEVIVGNHDTWESNSTNGGGSINKFIQYCPFSLGTYRGAYGFQYSFDYPSTSPLARFILVEPDEWNGTTSSSAVDYSNGTAAQAWVGSQIDTARSAGIPWIIVGMHKACITSGAQGCEITQDFMRFLINKKVDLVLQGHDHNYQRSKQLTCATRLTYVPSCVSNNGATGSYSKGSGTIFLIDGTGGDSTYGISAADPEYQYFAKLNDTSFGYTKYTVSSNTIQAQFVATSGTFTDTWSISGGTADFSIAANPTSFTLQAGSPGTSTINLSSLNGFSGSVTLSATVSPAGPTTSFSVNPVSLSSGGTASSTLTVSTTTSTAAGTYNITATGTSGTLSHKVSVIVTVTVPPLTATFTVSSSPTTGTPVTFTATASGGTPPYSYGWTFGDGGTGSGNPVSHTYSQKGNYNVTLTVTDAAARTFKRSSLVTVAPVSLGTSLSFTPGTPTVGQTVTFTAAVSGGSTPYIYSWTFGDGGTGSVNPVSHSYAAKGTYTVKLNVTDANGVKTTTTTTITVSALSITSSFTISSSPTAGSPVTFTATASGGTGPYTFAWGFGDTTAAAGNPVSHIYSLKGTYTVKLNVTDSNNVRATVSNAVSVSAPTLTVDFSVSPPSPTAGKTATFTGTGTGGTGPYTFSWNFGDGTPAGTGNPVAHGYSSKGTKTVTLTITDANGATKTATHTVSVSGQALVVTVTCPTSGVTVGKPFNCTVSATGGTSPYTGTGTFSRTEGSKGVKPESFTVTDANLVSASGSASVTVAAQALIVAVSCPTSGVTVGKPFNCTVTATGGTAPYTGTGTFSRTESTKGTKTESFTVSDTNNVTASGSASVTVATQALVVTVSCPTSGITAGKPFNCTVTATGGTAPYTGTGTVSRTEATKGTKTESFTVTDTNNVSASGSASVTVAAQALVVTVSCPTSGVTAGKPFNCTVTATGGTSPFTGTGTFSRTETTKGTKTESFTITDTNNVSASGSASVTVAAQALVVTVTCPTSGVTAGKPFSCTVTATGGTTPYTGTGTFSRAEGTKGTKTESFTITDSNNVSASGSASVSVATQPLVVTVSCPTSGVTAGKPFNCSVTATGGTAPYAGTGTFSRTEATKGTKTESFSVTDTNNVSGSGSASLSVAAQALAADFTFSPASPLAGQTVTFTATVSGGTAAYSFSWNFGDGSPAGSGNQVTHSYSTKGANTVTLTVTDANAATETAMHSVSVSGTALVGDFTFSPTSPTSGKSVTFTAQGVSGGTPPYTFSWSFGDDTAKGSAATIFHTFARKGSYTVILNVTDTNNALAQTSKTVVVGAQPLTADFSLSPGSPTAGKSVILVATVSGGTTPYSFSWSFGDGSLKQSGNPTSHTFTQKGSFTVMLDVTDANSILISVTKTITVSPQPLTLTASSSPSSSTAEKTVTFTATASGGTGPYTLVWNYGDGTTGTGVQSTHSYSTKGTYTIRANATDANGSKTITTIALSVSAQPLTISAQCGQPTTGKPFTCNATASGGTSPYTFTWSIDGAQASPGPTLTTSFPSKGPHQIIGVVTDANGQSVSQTTAVNVASQPMALSTSPSVTPTAGKPVTFTATISGGSSPYTIAWSFGDGSTGTGTTTVHTYAVKGTYSVRANATDANSDKTSFSSTIIVTAQPIAVSASYSPTIPTVGKPVTFAAIASGGTGPYTFSWVFGDGTTRTGNPAFHTYALKGTFNVTLTLSDANIATVTVSLAVGVSPQPLTPASCPSTAITGQPVTCTGTASGGTGPYAFSWDVNADGTIDGTGVTFTTVFPAKGTFTIRETATDANGATATVDDIIVVESQPITAQFGLSSPPVVGSPVTFDITGTGGTPPYSFQWDFGDGSQASGASVTHSYAVKGSYQVAVTVSDSNRASAHVTKTVTVAPENMTVSLTSALSATAGKPLELNASASGGTAPYTFNWLFGDDSNATGTSVVHQYSVKGSYNVTVSATDLNGAVATAKQLVTISPQPVSVSLSVTPVEPVEGEMASFEALVTGGTVPYTITWNFGDGSSGTGSPVTHSYSVGGSYNLTFTVADANGVSAGQIQLLTVVPPPLRINAFCAQSSAGKPVSCNASATGGTSPYSFSWDVGGDGSIDGTGDSFNTIFSAKGSYMIDTIVQGSDGLLARTSIKVTVIAQPLAADFFVDPSSPVVGDTVGFSSAASGGSAPYVYSWSFGDGTSQTGSQVSHIYSVKGTFTVSLTVTDSNNVGLTVGHLVSVAPLHLEGSTEVSSAASTGKPVTLTASITGGTGPYTVRWDFGDNSTGTGNPTTHTFSVKGNYNITTMVTDANGAIALVNLLIVVRPQPLVITASCEPGTAGKPTDCNASASGGTTPYDFTWNVGKDATIDGLGPSFTAVFPVKGSFSIDAVVTDANGATSFVNLPIVVRPQPLVITASCQSGTAGKPTYCNASASGGTAPYTFLWDVGKDSRTDGTGSTFTTIFPVKGTYSIDAIVRDSNNATAFVNLPLIVQPQQLIITASCQPGTAGKPTTCTASASGGTAPYAFSWDVGKDGTVDGNSANFTTVFPVKGSFSIDARVTDANYATTFVNLPIVIRPQPLVITASCQTITVGKPSHCNASASGGTQPYTFTWDVGKDGTIDGQGSGFIATFPVKGSYSIDARVTDGNGQSAFVNLPLTVTPQPLVITASCQPGTAGKPTNCNGSASGGTTPYSFSWDIGKDGTADGQDSTFTAAFPVKGTFSIDAIVHDANNATAFVNLPIVIRPQPLAIIASCQQGTAGKPTNCSASASGGTAPYTFLWDVGKDGRTDGSGSTFTTIFPVKGTFRIDAIVTDTNGATAHVNLAIIVDPQPLVINASCQPGTVGKPTTCSASALGGTTPYTITWDVGKDGTIDGDGENFAIEFPVKGTYGIDALVVDANGVRALVNLPIIVIPQPLLITASCQPGTAGKPTDCNASASGGTMPYTFTWDVGKDGSIDGQGAGFTTVFPVKGAYSIDAIVTDSNGATAIFGLPITVSAQPLASDFTASPASLLVGESVTFSASASGGTLPYSFVWNFGDGSTGIGTLVSHSYSVKGSKTVTLNVTDSNGISVAVSHFLTVNSQPLNIDFASSPNIPIANGSVSVTATATGGTLPYTFFWDFGDGGNSTSNPSTHTYLQAGNFTVTLTLTDANGASKTLSQLKMVLPWAPSTFRLDWADYDNNGKVDILDIAAAALCWARTSSMANWQSCSYWDFNLNGKIEITDIALAALYYGRTMTSPFPGQSQSQFPGTMDPQWHQYCSFLDPVDRQYCQKL